MFRKVAIATAAAVVLTMLVASPSTASPPPSEGETDRLQVYTGTVDAAGLAAIIDLGVDRHDVVTTAGAAPGQVEVQVILSGDQAAQLAADGTALEAKTPAAQRRSLDAAGGVFRTYSGEGGILEELMAQAAANPKIAEFRVIGQTVQGQDIGAVRLTKDVEEGEGRHSDRRRCTSAPSTHANGSPPRWCRRLLDLLPGLLRRRLADQGHRQHHRGVVRSGGQPRRVRLHVRRGSAALAEEPPRQQRRRSDHGGRRRRPQPQLPDPVGLRQRRLIA